MSDEHPFDHSAHERRPAFEHDTDSCTTRLIVSEDPWPIILGFMGELDEEAESDTVRAGMAEALRRVLQLLCYGDGGKLLPAQAAGVRAQSLAYVFGMLGEAPTLNEIAKPSELTRAAISKVVRKFAKRYGTASRPMRSAKAVEAYSERARRVYRMKRGKLS